jgi:hypothetical protein
VHVPLQCRKWACKSSPRSSGLHTALCTAARCCLGWCWASSRTSLQLNNTQCRLGGWANRHRGCPHGPWDAWEPFVRARQAHGAHRSTCPSQSACIHIVAMSRLCLNGHVVKCMPSYCMRPMLAAGMTYLVELLDIGDLELILKLRIEPATRLSAHAGCGVLQCCEHDAHERPPCNVFGSCLVKCHPQSSALG